jgi:hypothetical protein
MKKKGLLLSGLAMIIVCFLVLPVKAQVSMLGANQLGQLFRVDLPTCDATLLGTLPEGFAAEIEYDFLNKVLYATAGRKTPVNNQLHTIDPSTGESLGFVTLSPLGAEEAVTGMEFLGSTLYGTITTGGSAPSRLVTIDPATGTVTEVGPTGIDGPIAGLAFDKIRGVMFGIRSGGSISDLVTIDLDTGAATVIGSTGIDDIGSIEFGRDGLLYGGTSRFSSESGPGDLLRIDGNGGTATVIGPTGLNSITGLALFSERGTASVPSLNEVGFALTACLMILAGFMVLRRRWSV